MPDEIEHALLRAAKYLDSRRCRDGGYCFYRTDDVEESSVHDTYYALAACRLLGLPFHNGTISYLQRQPETSGQPYYLYYYVYSLRFLGLPVANETVFAVCDLTLDMPTAHASFPAWLDETLKIARLRKDFCGHARDAGIASFVRELLRNDGYGIKPTLENTFLALGLLETIGAAARDADTIRFVEDMQNSSLGFCNTRDSRYTNNSILHAGVGCCRLLGIAVHHPAAVIAGVLASQMADGAFASVASSLPDLHSHYLAIKIVRMLGIAATPTAELTREDVLG